jgi:hypothetical protein
MIDENDKGLMFKPMASVIDAPNGVLLHWKDHWWVHHPEKGIVFCYGNAQCHTDAQKVQKMIKDKFNWAELVFMPDVFIKSRMSEL